MGDVFVEGVTRRHQALSRSLTMWRVVMAGRLARHEAGGICLRFVFDGVTTQTGVD